MSIFLCFYELLYTGIPEQTEELSWGSHINKSFLQVIEAVYEKDKTLIDSHLLETSNIFHGNSYNLKNGNTLFIYPYGICMNFVEYDPTKEFNFEIFDGNNYTYENMIVFINDPAMLTHSSFDQQSHQGTKIFGLKRGYVIYDVEVGIKDSNNPSERDSCSLTSYADCVDEQTLDFFSEVLLKDT